MSNTLSVVSNDLFEFEEESTFELKDFPMPSEGTTMDLKEFLKVPTFPINLLSK